MNALKSLASPTPVRSLVVGYYTRFTTENSKQQKKSNKSRRNCKFALSGDARDNATLIGLENPAKVQIGLCFFASDQMTTRSLDSDHTSLRQIAPGRLPARIAFAAAA
jgi:hypothetical protein